MSGVAINETGGGTSVSPESAFPNARCPRPRNSFGREIHLGATSEAFYPANTLSNFIRNRRTMLVCDRSGLFNSSLAQRNAAGLWKNWRCTLKSGDLDFVRNGAPSGVLSSTPEHLLLRRRLRRNRKSYSQGFGRNYGRESPLK